MGCSGKRPCEEVPLSGELNEFEREKQANIWRRHFVVRMAHAKILRQKDAQGEETVEVLGDLPP